MNCYLCLNKNTELFDDNWNFFKLGTPVLWDSFETAKAQLKNNQVVVHIEFVDLGEVLEALQCAYNGNSIHDFKIKVLGIYSPVEA